MGDIVSTMIGFLFTGTIASNTMRALVIALVLFWLVSITPEPRPRPNAARGTRPVRVITED